VLYNTILTEEPFLITTSFSITGEPNYRRFFGKV
jgi:hypothetical protein